MLNEVVKTWSHDCDDPLLNDVRVRYQESIVFNGNLNADRLYMLLMSNIATNEQIEIYDSNNHLTHIFLDNRFLKVIQVALKFPNKII